MRSFIDCYQRIAFFSVTISILIVSISRIRALSKFGRLAVVESSNFLYFCLVRLLYTYSCNFLFVRTAAEFNSFRSRSFFSSSIARKMSEVDAAAIAASTDPAVNPSNK